VKKKTGLLRVYYESLSAHIFTSTRKNTLILSPVPLEAWLLEASPADIRKMCVCPPALRKLRTYDDADSQTMPVEHPPTPPPCRWPALITLPTLAKCCSAPPACSSTPLRPSLPYPSISLVVNIMCIQTFISWQSKCPLYSRPDRLVSFWSRAGALRRECPPRR